jgi:hypothetical protein
MKPYFLNTVSMVLKMYLRFCTSAGPKSRVPLGILGFCAISLGKKLLCYSRKAFEMEQQ